MSKKKDIIAGVDLGGTSLRALVVDGRNTIQAIEKIPTRPDESPTRLIRDIAGSIRKAVAAANTDFTRVAAVSVGAPGAVDPESGIVYKAPNLGWLDVPLGPRLGSLLGVPVLVENDVNVGTVGEHVLGAGKGTRDMVGIFVGTGIGGGIIVGGELYEGFRGAAGEIGHILIQKGGPLCGCGKRGCVEALASRTAMEREVRAAVRAGVRTVIPSIMKERGRKRMTSSVIARALRKRDPLIRRVLRDAEFYLGVLVANLVNTLDPECVVIGGGIAERLGEAFVGPIRRTAYRYFMRQDGRERIRIVPGILGDNAGALGAAALARKRLGR